MLIRRFFQKVNSLRNSLNVMTDQMFVAVKASGDRIPKIVHQTYAIDPESPDFPVAFKENLDALKRDNPEWEFRFYNDDDVIEFIQQKFPELVEIYQRIDPRYGAARADFFRYLVVFEEGGLYLDVKSGALRGFDDIIREDDKMILSFWPRSWPKNMLGQHPGITNSVGELQQWYVAAISGHPLLASVINNVCYNIENYNPILHDYGSWGVLNLTGPIAFTEAIYPQLDKHPHRLEEDHLVCGFEYSVLSSGEIFNVHQREFSESHYSTLTVPVVRQSLPMNIQFLLSKPIVFSLRFLHRRMRKS